MNKKKILKLAKGNRGRSKNCFRIARPRVEKGLQYQYRDRRQQRRNVRKVWIQQINAGSRQFGLGYGQFINGLDQLNIKINRKMLAELAISEPYSFLSLVDHSKAKIGKKWRDINLDRDWELPTPHPEPLPESFQPKEQKPGDQWKPFYESLRAIEEKARDRNVELVDSGEVVIPDVEVEWMKKEAASRGK
eukprot:TRINITY_DN4953_c0_g1_i1.p1 TRINITY_DN4953_c0_g1~~TRINITY_DN4953_c0_g1_i1.p1  ORF type:complete len:191 (-),score=47.14 TRINITY_DN4953_c0_g1_i1:16-588(-)